MFIKGTIYIAEESSNTGTKYYVLQELIDSRFIFKTLDERETLTPILSSLNEIIDFVKYETSARIHEFQDEYQAIAFMKHYYTYTDALDENVLINTILEEDYLLAAKEIKNSKISLTELSWAFEVKINRAIEGAIEKTEPKSILLENFNKRLLIIADIILGEFYEEN